MQVIKVKQNTPEWLAERRGHIGGSDLKDIATERGNGVKIGIYKLIADRIAVTEDIEDWRERGHDLEAEAIEHLNIVAGLKLVNGGCIWRSDDDPDIQVSPDAYSEDNRIAAEVKCLSGPYHLEAIIDFRASVKAGQVVRRDKIPSGFRHQAVQYFIVNDELETLYFVLYNPSIASLPMHVIEVEREDVAGEVDHYKALEMETLAGVRMICEELTF